MENGLLSAAKHRKSKNLYLYFLRLYITAITWGNIKAGVFELYEKGRSIICLDVDYPRGRDNWTLQNEVDAEEQIRNHPRNLHSFLQSLPIQDLTK
jgi:hypothetical protein